MPVITLTTDFGDSAYVGAMRGVLHGLHADARVVDVTHGVPAHDIAAGALALLVGVPHYPGGSIHVAVVDPGVGTRRRGLLVKAGGHFLVGPDNGLLVPVAERLGVEGAWVLENADLWRRSVSATFHGRDVFAPVAAQLAKGTPPDAVGPAVAWEDVVPAPWERHVAGKGRAEGVVVTADRFGNLITNVPAEDLPADVGDEVTVTLGDRHFRLHVGRTYGDVDEGELLVLVGSTGLVEVAAREESAAEMLDLAPGAEVLLERNA